MATVIERGPIAASEDERAALAELARLLASADEGAGLALAGPGGEQVALPASAARALRRAVDELARGRSVSVVEMPRELTTQQAAELLHVSRPFLVERLLDKGEIPYVMVGTHRRIALEDVLAYQQRRTAERKRHLKRLVELSEEYGLYRE
jgi:excisionase family DNA binding protein